MPDDPISAPPPSVPQIKPADLRGILEYVPMFREHIFVIAIDGSVIGHENFPNLITDIAVLRSLNIKVVIVHGIGRQMLAADTRQKTQGFKWTETKPALKDFYGEGVTCATMLRLAREAAGVVTQTVVEALSRAGLKTAITNAVRATAVGILGGRDQQFTGKVEKIDTALIKSLLEQGVVPVFTPIQCNREGCSLRINSDLLAAELAIALGASKLIFLTSHSGLRIGGKIAVNIPLKKLAALFRDERGGGIASRLRSKAAHAVRVLECGTGRAHILDGSVNGGLLTEIFDKVGTGTMIHADDYEQIRPARKKDAQAIYNFTKQGTRTETLLHRTHTHIEQHIEDYFVYEIDESVIACAAFRYYAGTSVAEVCSVYVQPSYHGRGIGKKLVEYATAKAAENGLRRLFALTTQSRPFFRDICGFADATLEDLPPERLESARASGRNARVLVKDLGQPVRRKTPATGAKKRAP
ncbi:MAG: amino-acid N-acetyltransferase [Puniceicoccales bacterium]|nr:amino-acid N-acetyltransferase [Puniceicoccales bacterium]